ncbi:MAG TPA: hypothetical protein VH913_14440 [Hyphomicrobiaceae bacterium]|jgi:hypothetical protein
MPPRKKSRREALREFSEQQADLFGDPSIGRIAPPAAPKISEYRRQVHGEVRAWLRDGYEYGAVSLLLQLLTEDERRRIMRVLTNMSHGPPRRMTAEESAAADAARKSGRTWKEELALRREQRERAAVEELQALLASGGRTH